MRGFKDATTSAAAEESTPHRDMHKDSDNLTATLLCAEATHLFSAFEAAKGRALPGATCDKLEWPGADFLATCRNADHHRHAPSPTNVTIRNVRT